MSKDDLIDFTLIPVEERTPPKKHPKCGGPYYSTTWNESHEFDCSYNTTLECDECKYCLDARGRKDPAAKCNQVKD